MTETFRLRGGPTLRWGVVGAGDIAAYFTDALHRHTDQRVIAVGSRTPDRAATFAARFTIPTAGTHQDVFTHPDVDIVYIAAINSLHHDLALAAILAGKHVLVEKPLATSHTQAEEIVTAARTAGVFAMEALWTRYLPHTRRIHELLTSGAIGDVTLATASIGWRVPPEDPAPRMRQSALGGGATLDGGVYALWFTQFALGGITDITALTNHAGDIDIDFVAAVRGPGGGLGTATGSMTATTAGAATIVGTHGRIDVKGHFVFPAALTLTTDDETTTWTDDSGIQGRDGLAWQAAAAAHYISRGLTESPLHTLDQILELAHAMDLVRAAT